MSTRGPLTELVCDHLRRAIESRHLAPGDEIDFAKLAANLKISRTPIRESIRKLHLEGLLELLSGGRIRVATLSLKEAEDFYVVRLELEVAAARAAALQISEYEIEMLRLNVERFISHRHEPEQLPAIDKQFHNILYDASRNRYLSQCLNSLRIVLGLFRDPAYDQASRIDQTHAEHVAILRALTEGDSDATADAVTRHIQNAKDARLGIRTATSSDQLQSSRSR